MNVRALAALLAVLAVAAFAPALRGPQLFDDAAAIQGNPSIRQLWPISVPLHPPPGSAVSGRPIANLSLAVDYGINELFDVGQRPDPQDPGKTVIFHLTNLLMHLGAGLLLFGIVRRTLASGRYGDAWQRNAAAAAAVAAAIWLLHPLQAEPVDYLVQRTELLAGLCYLATLYCSVRAWDTVDSRPRGRWMIAGVCACAAGMGSKEIMVSAPMMVMLYDRVFRLDSWRSLRDGRFRQRRWFYGGLWATLIVLVVLLAGAPRGTSIGFHAGMPWYEYLHSQGWAIAHYLRLALWPAGFSIDYGADPVAHWRGLPGLALLLLLGGATLAAWWRIDRWGWAAFLGTWFFAILAPSSSVVPIVTEIAAERRMYLPLAAIAVAAVVGAGVLVARVRAIETVRTRRLTAAAALVLIACLAALTFSRSRMYQDPERLWREAILRQPGNSRAWYNHGVMLANLSVPRRAAADSDYREAVRLNPAYADALLRLALDDLTERRYAEATADLAHYPLGGGNDTVLVAMGKALFGSADTAGAQLAFERAAEQPSTVETLTTFAAFELSIGRDSAATAVIRRAIALAPGRTDLLVFLAGELYQQGHPDQAIPLLEEAVKREPDSQAYRAHLAEARAAIRRY